MTKKDICVVIPIYKKVLNNYEEKAVLQCLKVLSEYVIIFVAPKKLDVSFYKIKFGAHTDLLFFEDHYFKDLEGYNRLMLDFSFYKCFKDYKYILIYQTDCYVFKDELLFWAEKKYDYIGGLWFEGFTSNPDLGAKLWCAGNGGFSLRKVNTFMNILSSKKPLKNWRKLVLENRNTSDLSFLEFIKSYLLMFFKLFGYKNNTSFLATNFKKNEDVFFSNLYLDYKLITMPEVDKALLFSWDRRPDFLYNKMGMLPFACHAWFRNDKSFQGNKEFWSKFIY